MKAIVMREAGGPEVLRHETLPDPVPGHGEVLVKAHAIGVNRPEILVRQGSYRWMPPLPAIPGIEMSGTIAALGPGISGRRMGEKVFVSARDLSERAGCYAEYIAVPSIAAHPLPDETDLDHAACLSNYDVAFHCLHTARRSAPAQNVLVTGASGGIGGAAVQLAKAAGLTVLALAGSPQSAGLLRADGDADAVVEAGGGLKPQIMAVTGGKGVDLVLDFVGGSVFCETLQGLAPFGLLISCGRVSGPPRGELNAALMDRLGDSLAVRFFSMHALDGQTEIRRAGFAALAQLLAEGRIRPKIGRIFPLAEAGAAQHALETRAVRGKILLRP